MKAKVEPQRCTLKNGVEIIIREAEPSDAKEMIAYQNKIGGESDFVTFGAGEFDMTETEETEFLKKCQTAKNQIFLVATIDNKMIGTLHFATGRRPRVRHSGEFGISTSKDYWGLGVGGLLLDALIFWARDSRFVKKINLKVRTDNPRAITLYKNKGFIHEGTLSNEICIDGRYYDLYAMGLNL